MIEIEIEAEAWAAAIDGVESMVERAVTATLAGADGGVVVVLLTDDATIRELNQRFRGKDQPTNVLSFPAADMPKTDGPAPLGDIVLAYGVCVAEAQAQGKTMADHLTHLVVHGTLHLLGRDHENEAEAEAMEGEERAVLAGLGVADPYGLSHDV